MTYKLTVTTLALTAITSTVAATHAKPDTEHPHIVLILCDDMGFSDLSGQRIFRVGKLSFKRIA